LRVSRSRPFILPCCSGPYLSNRNCSSECKNAGPSEAVREQAGDRLGAARKQLRHQRAKREVTHCFALRVRHGCASRRMGSDFGERHHHFSRPRDCATQVIVLAYQTLHRRAPASATYSRMPPATMPAAIESSAENLRWSPPHRPGDRAPCRRCRRARRQTESQPGDGRAPRWPRICRAGRPRSWSSV